MSIFNLPDLGEGLAEAEIREWFVNVGDEVNLDQPLLSVETAKAIVEVPSPQSGKVTKIFGKAGDIVPTHSPLVEFDDAAKDQGSVVGNLKANNTTLIEENVIVGSANTKSHGFRILPAARALARQLNVDINELKPSGPNNTITTDDVKNAAQTTTAETFPSEPLKGVRRSMAIAMTHSHQSVVPATIIDDADITEWPSGTDITVRLIKAMQASVEKEPALNAWFDSQKLGRVIHQHINLGLALDSFEGLFVPVIKDIDKKNAEDIRTQINYFKKAVQTRSINANDLQDATITLSNFGTIAGLYATPIIVPPMVSILGCGKIREVVLPINGELLIRRILPLSLTFDHRAVTGGEASRFLGAMIEALQGTL